MRTWIFAVVVALVLAINLGLVSLRIAQTGEETVRARVALATSALKGQLELIDARLSPRAVAANPDLIEATRPPVDPTQPLTRPDERALRAAAASISPEPDLLIVASAQGGIVSRRAKAAQAVDDPSTLPLVKSGLEGAPPPTFATLDGALYRVAASRIPGNAAVVVVGMLVDDRMAAQLRSQVDADVTLLQGGKPVASSLPLEDRARLARWAAAPAPGYGVLQVRLPVIGSALSGRLPRGATRYAVRGALVPLGVGVQAALTVPASPYLGWLARYQAFYLLALVAFLLLSFLWGLLARAPVAAAPAPQRAPRPRSTPPPVVIEEPGPQPSLDVGNPLAADAPAAPRDVPWREGEGPSGEHAKPLPAEPLLAATPVALPDAAERRSASGDEAHAASSAEASPSRAALLDELPETTSVFAAPHPPVSSGQDADFSFAGLLDDSQQPSQPAQPSLSEDLHDSTVPGRPNDELIAQSKPDYGGLGAARQDYFPGDEPTRIEPVSAALLDKLREKDDPAGETEPLPDSAIEAVDGPAMPSAEPVLPLADGFAMPPAAERTAPVADLFAMLPTEEQTMPAADAFAMPAPDEQAMPASDAFAMPPPDEQTMPASDAFAMPQSEEAAANSAAPDEEGHAAPTTDEHAAHEHAAHDERGAHAQGADEEQAAHDEHAAREPQPAAGDVTLHDFSLSTESDRDPDESHWQETFEQFRELKAALGEPADRITFEKFSAKLRKNRADLMAKHHCKGVRFVVYEKEGKAAIKASAVR